MFFLIFFVLCFGIHMAERYRRKIKNINVKKLNSDKFNLHYIQIV